MQTGMWDSSQDALSCVCLTSVAFPSLPQNAVCECSSSWCRNLHSICSGRPNSLSLNKNCITKEKYLCFFGTFWNMKKILKSIMLGLKRYGRQGGSRMKGQAFTLHSLCLLRMSLVTDSRRTTWGTFAVYTIVLVLLGHGCNTGMLRMMMNDRLSQIISRVTRAMKREVHEYFLPNIYLRTLILWAFSLWN